MRERDAPRLRATLRALGPAIAAAPPLEAARAGLGLSIQSKALVAPDLDSGQLTTLYEGDPEGLGYYIVTRPGVLSPGARAFRAWLRKMAQAQV